MENPELVVEQKVAQKTRVGRSILLGLAVSAMSLIFFGFNAVMLLGGNEGGGDGGGEFVPLPAYDVQTVSSTPRFLESQSITFYSGSTQRLLGTYTRSELYRDGSAYPFDEAQPLLLGFRSPFESTNITVALNNGWTVNICIPAIRFSSRSETLLRVDIDGTLFSLDGATRSRHPCSGTSASALTPLSIEQATVNESYTGSPNDSWVDFRRDFIAHLGTFDPRANTYTQASDTPIPGSRSPLLIRYWNSNVFDAATFPARNYVLRYTVPDNSLTGVTQKEITLCVPGATLQRRSTVVPTEKYFYVAKNGTLYNDPLLLEPATMTGCPIVTEGTVEPGLPAEKSIEVD